MIEQTMKQRTDQASYTHKSTINAFGHINIISRSSPGTILPLLGINSNSLCRTSSLTKLAGDTPFLPRRITPQGVLPTETGREVSLLVRVVDGYFGFEGDFTREPEGTPDFGHEEDFGGAFEDVFPGGLLN
jgi:hypothetical protein